MSYKTLKKLNVPTGGVPERNNPPFSVPDVKIPHWEIHDNVVDIEFQKQVHEYLQNCTWHQVWSTIPGELQRFKPADNDNSWLDPSISRSTLNQPRTMFGSDYSSTKKRHPIIAELWDRINEKLGNNYSISGADEGMAWQEYPVPTPEDPNLSTGWRVYANGSVHDFLSLQGYVHRDNFDLADETSVTILWVSNLEWYPSWGGEIMLYPEDPDGLTGDHQQFNYGQHQQKRNFKIGWPDEGKLVSLRPNRLLMYDSRTLHATLPTRHRNNSTMFTRVCFRARKIK